METEVMVFPGPSLSAPEDSPVTGGGGEGRAGDLTRGPPLEPPPPTKEPREGDEEEEEDLFLCDICRFKLTDICSVCKDKMAQWSDYELSD